MEKRKHKAPRVLPKHIDINKVIPIGSLAQEDPFEGVKVEMKWLTPEDARAILEHTQDHDFTNRQIVDGRVARYAKAMVDRMWKFNGDAVRIDKYGVCIDGQHRLWAVLQTGISIPVLMVTGLPRIAFSTIDDGRQRTAADVLGISGIGNSVQLATALRIIAMYEAETWDLRFKANIDNQATLALARKHHELSDSFSFVSSISKNRRLPAPLNQISAFLYLASRVDEELAKKFVVKLVTGTGFDADDMDQVYYLRERLRSADRLTATERLYLIFRAWNAMRAGELLKKIPLPQTPVTPPRLA